MSEHALIQQQRAILRALRQANTRHAQVITAADAQWQQVQRAYEEVQTLLTRIGEEKALMSSQAFSSTSPNMEPTQVFQLSVERAIQAAEALRTLLHTTPPTIRHAKTWQAHRIPLIGYGKPLLRIAFSPDGSFLASGGHDNLVKIWEVTSGRLLYSFQGHAGTVYSVAFSPDGRLLASGSYDRSVKVWDVAAGRLLHTLTGHSDVVFSVAFSPDGSSLASGSLDTTVKVWEPVTGRLLHNLRGHNGHVTSVAFSPDSRLLASGAIDNTVKVWDTTSANLLHSLSENTGTSSVVFSPDGRLLASGNTDNIKIWDVVTARLVQNMVWYKVGAAWGIAFSPDGRLLASAHPDKTVRIWQVTNARLVQTIPGPNEWVTSVAFSPMGGLLAVGCKTKIVTTYPPASRETG